MPIVTVNGVCLHYLQYPAEQSVSADSPPVLLLVGIDSDSDSDSDSWQPVIEPLRQRFDLLIPDIRCTGRTTPSDVVERVANLVSAAALPQILPARIVLFRTLRSLRATSNEADWYALHWEQPEAFVRVVREALATVGSE